MAAMSRGKGMEIRVPSQIQSQVHTISYWCSDGAGSPVDIHHSGWSDTSVCAQYEPATWNDRSWRPCVTFADWVVTD